MIKVQIVSDIHCEFYRDDGAAVIAGIPVAGDVLVIAGDLLPAKWARKRVVEVLRRFTDRWPAVVYVAGNHEAYGLPIGVTEFSLLKASLEAGVEFLANEAREVAGLRFFGGTGWFPDRRGDMGWSARKMMPEFSIVRGIEDDAPASNRLFDERLSGEAGAVDVVVSHHLPAACCVAPKYAGQALNAFFVADFEHLLFPTKAQLWAYGHTHTRGSILVGDTNLVCNPHGYPGEVPGPYPTVVVDVEPRQPKETP